MANAVGMTPEWPHAQDFKPLGWLRSGHVQTMLSSSSWRHYHQRCMRARLRAHAQPVVLRLEHDVRLSGIFTPAQATRRGRGLAILLHGWEGSIESSYVVQTGQRLLADGWDIFRLNFRDHGDTHHLNPGLFHSCLLDEAVSAIKTVIRQWHVPATPLSLSGFSLGGNFALRVAIVAAQEDLPLDRVIAVCPIIDPGSGLFALEHSAPWVYQWYFLRNWRRSLKRKARLFPQRFSFSRRELHQNMRELTRTMVTRYTRFGSLQNYLDGYSVADDRMAHIAVPTTILTSKDDPIIPVEDFEQLTLSPHVELDIAAYGGHCGFLSDWHLHCFTDDYIAARLNAITSRDVRQLS